MAPTRAPKARRTQELDIVRSDGIEVERPSQPGSQSSDDNQVTKLATKMQREVRNRRETRRAVINSSYREAVRKIEDAMTAKFGEITRRMVKRHRLRMDRLNNLIQRRSNIEARMCASSQNIMNAFIYADKALAFAFARRIQGIGKYQNAPIA